MLHARSTSTNSADHLTNVSESTSSVYYWIFFWQDWLYQATGFIFLVYFYERQQKFKLLKSKFKADQPRIVPLFVLSRPVKKNVITRSIALIFANNPPCHSAWFIYFTDQLNIQSSHFPSHFHIGTHSRYIDAQTNQRACAKHLKTLTEYFWQTVSLDELTGSVRSSSLRVSHLHGDIGTAGPC